MKKGRIEDYCLNSDEVVFLQMTTASLPIKATEFDFSKGLLTGKLTFWDDEGRMIMSISVPTNIGRLRFTGLEDNTIYDLRDIFAIYRCKVRLRGDDYE